MTVRQTTNQIPAETPPTRYGTFRQRLRLKFLDRDVQRLSINIALILLIGTLVHLEGGGKFFTIRNLDALAIQISVVTIIACAMTLVMVAGAIDVSVPGTVVLSGVVAGILIVNAGLPMWLAFVLATLTGVLVGLINSYLVITIGITSLIATIGTLYVTQGVADLLTNGLPIIGLPMSFSEVGSGHIGRIPIPLPITLAVVILFVAIQRFTRFGRHTIATGSNPQAAFLNGVNIRRTLTICFMLSGAAAGWGGVMYASRIGNPSPTLDNDLLFQIIVAIVIGGTGLTGGQGSVSGTFFGAVLIGVVNQALNLLGVSGYWQYIALGILLVFSVGSDEVMRRGRVAEFRRWIVSAWRSSNKN